MRKIAVNFVESGDFHVTLGYFICRKFTTWDRRLYFLSEGRRAEDGFGRFLLSLSELYIYYCLHKCTKTIPYEPTCRNVLTVDDHVIFEICRRHQKLN